MRGMTIVCVAWRQPLAVPALVAVFLGGSLPAPAAAAPAEPVAAAPSAPSRVSSGSLSLGLLAGLTYGNRVGAGSTRALLGYGGHAGYRFGTTPVYLGVTVLYRRDDPPEERGDAEQRISVDLDVGGELAAGWLSIRPYLGLGASLFIYDGPDGGSGIVSLLAPGVFVHHPFGFLDVGVDVRWEALPSHWGDSLVVLGSVGFAI
jgi:hypothetical protein